MNPGGSLPQRDFGDAELGEALHHRLAELAARLERLTGAQGAAVAAGQVETRPRPGFAASPYSLPNQSDDVSRPEHRPDLVNLTPASGGPNWVAQASPPPDSASIAQIAEALRRLEADPPRPLAAAFPAAEASLDHHTAEQRLRAIRDRIEALKARHPAGHEINGRTVLSPQTSWRPPPLPAYADPAQSGEPAPRSLDFNAAVAEITARQRQIDEFNASNGEMHRAGSSTQPNVPQIGGRSDATADNELGSALAELRRQVGDLTGSVREQESRAPGAPDLAAITAGQADIIDRLDRMSRRSDGTNLEAVAQQLLHRVPSSDRIDTLSVEIDRLSERMSAMDHGDELTRLDKTLTSLGQQVIAAVEATGAGANGNQRFEAEIAGIRDAIEGMYRMLHNSGSPALARLEERLNQVSERFESTLQGAPRADTIADLLSRLELIAARGETAPAALESLAAEIAELRARERSELASLDHHIQALAQRLEETVLGQTREGSAVADLEGLVGTLADRLDAIAVSHPSVGSQDELQQVEDQLTAISGRIDRLDTGSTSEDVGRLEQQISTLVSRLEGLSGDHETLRTVQESLSRLESMVVDSEFQSIDAIREAARDAVNELSGVGQSRESATLDALKRDLREMQDAALGSDQQGAFDHLNQTLDRVVGRLGSLEEEVRSPGSGTFAPADTQPDEYAVGRGAAPTVTALDASASESGTADEYRTAIAGPAPVQRRPSAESPSPPPHARDRVQPQRPDPRHLAGDEPLQPGSPRPKPGVQAPTDRDRRADFIAAARRAAQAAAAEHDAVQPVPVLEQGGADQERGALGRFRRFIGDRRRLLMIAAGAVVLAIVAYQVIRPFDVANTPSGQPAVAIDAVEPTPVAETPQPQPVTPAAAIDNSAALDDAAEPLPGQARAGEAEGPAPALAAPAVAAFIPPDGVVSPVLEPIADLAPGEAADEQPAAADADVASYPMPEEAVGSARLRVAAAAGDPAALYEVGARYADGWGVERDLSEAAIWLERAAQRGLAVAQHRLATLYEAGLGVPEDRTVAYRWYLAAAEQTNILAMHNLGVMFSQGITAEADFALAIEWFTAAAEHGVADSQYNLGVIYARAIGVDKDLVASYQWFAIAAAQGDSDAAARRDEIASEMSGDELAAARAAVSAWSAREAPPSANTVEIPPGGWDEAEERVSTDDQQQLVATIQALLSERGFHPGPADGLAGPATRNAVRAFQAAIGLAPTGIIDEALLEALFDEAA